MLYHKKRDINKQKRDINSETIQSKQADRSQKQHPYTGLQRIQLYPESATHADILQLQRTVGNNVVMQLFKDIGSPNTGNDVLQAKSETTIKQELRTGALLANYKAGFIGKHLGLGRNSNVSAAQVHANRTDDVATNTVIIDAGELKNSLADVSATWTSIGENEWDVKTHGNVTFQDTKKEAGELDEQPEQKRVLYDQSTADNFTVEGGEVTAMTDVDATVLRDAKLQAGAYPRNGNSDKKRRYRRQLIEKVNAIYAQRYNAGLAKWVRDNFQEIGDVALDEDDHKTVGDINGIPKKSGRIEVFINDDGQIYHLKGTD